MARFYSKDITKDEFLKKVEEMFFGDKVVTKTIYKDLSKVEFEWENCDKVDDHGDNGYIEPVEGLHTQLMYVGGDGEMPIHFALYWDGKELRAYVPSKGNPWDKEEKIAWDYETWAEDKTKDPLDYNLMVEDILKRIKLKA
jgi:hypothetical protein